MDSPIPPDPYNALGISKTATQDEVRKAYRKLALRLHPDKCNDESLKASRTDEFHLVQQAYDILGEEANRERYDAQIHLAELRRQNMELRGQANRGAPAPAPRYDVRTAAPRDSSYATRSPPSRSYDDRQRYYEYDEAPRASAKKTAVHDEYQPPRRESPPTHARVSSESESRRRAEKKREASVRESRSTKYEYDARDAYEEERRRKEKEYETRRPPMPARREAVYGNSFTSSSEAERKMANREREAQRHIATSYTRSAAPRDPVYEPRRSSAPSKEKQRSSTRRTSPDKDERRRMAENVDPYATLKSHNSSPPVMSNVPKTSRSYTTQTNVDSRRAVEEQSPPPAFRRTATEPMKAPATSSSRRKESTTAGSRLRHEATQPDSGYSSPAATPYTTAKPSYTYPTYAEEAVKSPETQPAYRTIIREPGSSRRTQSPSPIREARPAMSNTATKMANLASASKPSTKTYRYPEVVAAVRPSLAQTSTSRAVPTTSSRRSERERPRYDEPARKLYGEMGPGETSYSRASQPTSYETEGVSFAPTYSMNDIKFASNGSRSSRRDRDEDFIRPKMARMQTYAY